MLPMLPMPVLLRTSAIIIAVIALMGVAPLPAQEPPAAPPALPAVPAAGLVVYKLHRQADDYAPCVEYANIKLFPTVANMTTTDGRFFSVQRGQMVHHVTYPSPVEELIGDADIARLQERLTEYHRLSQRFRQTAPLLAPWIARFRQELSMVAQGYGRAEGRWVDRSAYAFERERARLRQGFALRKAEILGNQQVPLATADAEPPLWAAAMEAQTLAEQAAFREEFRKRMLASQAARAEEFHRSREKQASGVAAGSGRLRQVEKPGGRAALEPSTKLDLGGGLDHTGPLDN